MPQKTVPSPLDAAKTERAEKTAQRYALILYCEGHRLT